MDALLAARSQEKLTPTAAEHVKLVAEAKKASDTRMAQQKAMLKADKAEAIMKRGAKKKKKAIKPKRVAIKEDSYTGLYAVCMDDDGQPYAY